MSPLALYPTYPVVVLKWQTPRQFLQIFNFLSWLTHCKTFMSRSEIYSNKLDLRKWNRRDWALSYHLLLTPTWHLCWQEDNDRLGQEGADVAAGNVPPWRRPAFRGWRAFPAFPMEEHRWVINEGVMPTLHPPPGVSKPTSVIAIVVFLF